MCGVCTTKELYEMNSMSEYPYEDRFLRIKESRMKIDSSATAIVNPLGLCELIILAFFEIYLSLLLMQH
jgi:hypothetical protein